MTIREHRQFAARARARHAVTPLDAYESMAEYHEAEVERIEATEAVGMQALAGMAVETVRARGGYTDAERCRISDAEHGTRADIRSVINEYQRLSLEASR